MTPPFTVTLTPEAEAEMRLRCLELALAADGFADPAEVVERARAYAEFVTTAEGGHDA